jgi:hypothetical protein
MQAILDQGKSGSRDSAVSRPGKLRGNPDAVAPMQQTWTSGDAE